ncbi:MAG TPA: DMT family transporter [Ignavibacteriaceae bacterium]|nr:DMT family transporter [Ignavibacteriaceae bacterium]
MKSNLLLLLTAVIWGFAFVAQRAGMEYLGPFTFNTARFTLGSLSLIPLLLINQKRKFEKEKFLPLNDKNLLYGGLAAGTVLFLGATFQQGGLVYTDAGKAGFITGFYIILVPILGLFIKQKTSFFTWLGAIVAIVGLYFLGVNESFDINLGDVLVLVGAFFWAIQILVIGFYSKKSDPFKLAFSQFVVCAVLSFIAALISETIILQNILLAYLPILYAGLFSVGIAFTIQVVAQRDAHPANAAIIMSLEAVFAVIGGWMILNESIPLRGLFGCVMMLIGMIISQLYLFRGKK